MNAHGPSDIDRMFPRSARERLVPASRTAIRLLLLLAVAAGLGSCLLDLEGGPARVQVRAWGADTLSAITIDAWRHEFAPPLLPGKTSETIELPVSGRLRIAIWARREGRDSLVSRRELEIGVGEFLRIE